MPARDTNENKGDENKYNGRNDEHQTYTENDWIVWKANAGVPVGAEYKRTGSLQYSWIPTRTGRLNTYNPVIRILGATQYYWRMCVRL